MFARDSLAGPRAGTYLDLAAGAQLVGSIDNDLVALCETGLYRCVSALGHSNLDWTNIRGVVRLDDIDESTLGTALDRNSGDQDLCSLHIYEQPRVYKLVGEQSVLLIVKNGFESRGARSRVNLVIEGEEAAGSDFSLAAAVIGIHREMLAGPQPGENIPQIIFGDRKQHGDGLDLGDDQEPAGIAGVDHVAGIHKA